MNCSDVEDALLDYLEGQLAEPLCATVRSHVSQCDACRSALEDLREMLGTLESARARQERAWKSFSRASRGEAPTASGPASRPGAVLGDFEIVDEIGRGGMGVVYRARQRSLNRLVALKVMPGFVAASRSAVTRFQREAQAAARLHHTNIVPVYAQGEQDGHFYYAMELIDGVNLGHLLRDNPSGVIGMLTGTGAATPSERGGETANASPAAPGQPVAHRTQQYRALARLLAEVADALDHAHRQNVIHRDIKPQNLLLDGRGQLHITDFGLARLLDEPNVTVTGEMLGTPAYMSPEQVDSDRDRIDHRTDIYSLGVTLYELLTGRRPFEGTSREQIIGRIRTREPRPPRKWNAAIPVDLDTICLRAMEKNPGRRYPSAAEMASDLRRYAEDRPILSRRVGPVEKAVKWVRRHPALTTIIVLCVLLVGGATAWSVQRAHDRRTRALEQVNDVFEELAYDDYRRFEPALAALDQLAPIVADEPEYLMTRALANILREPAESVRLLDRAISLRPQSARIRYLHAWALRSNARMKEYEQAIETADAMGGPAGDAVAHFFRAQALVRNHPARALDGYRTARALKDDYYQAILHLARAQNHWMYHNRSHERFGEIKENLDAAMILQRKSAYPRYLASLAYRISAEIWESQGDAAKAEGDFAKALNFAQEAQSNDCEPQNPRGYDCEAEYWESRGDFKRALDARNRGMVYCESEADRAGFLLYRWRLYYWLDHLDEAEADLAAVSALTAPSELKSIWLSHLLPALLQLERGEADAAMQRALAAAQGQANARVELDAAACLYWLNRPDAARALLHASWPAELPANDAAEPPDWTARKRSLLLGEQSIDELTKMARDGEFDKSTLAAPYFYAAALAFSQGRFDEMRQHLAACEATYDFDEYCYLAKTISRRDAAEAGWAARMRSTGAAPQAEAVLSTGSGSSTPR